MLGCWGWLAFSLTLVPLVHGQVPTWSADAATRAYPEFVGDLRQGGVAGVLVAVVMSGQPRRIPNKPGDRYRRVATRIVIMGGGFAGLSAAQRCEHLTVRGAPIDVTLVSDSNFCCSLPCWPKLPPERWKPGISVHRCVLWCPIPGFAAARWRNRSRSPDGPRNRQSWWHRNDSLRSPDPGHRFGSAYIQPSRHR